MAATRVSNRSVAAGVAASLGLLALPVPAAQAQTGAWEAHVDDSLILEARIGQYRLLGDIRGYFTDRGVCVSFEDLIQVLDLLVEIDEKSRRATGWLFSEERTLAIDRDADTVAISGNSAALRPGDIYDTPEGWCVDIGALSDWTGLTFSLDRVNLLLDIKSETKLPFLEAMERKNRAARLSAARPVFDIADLPQAALPYRAWRTPAVDILARLRYEQRGGSERRETRYELYASGEIARASVDARFASDNAGVPQSLRMRAYRFDPDGGLLGPLGATQIAVGDVETRRRRIDDGADAGDDVGIFLREVTRDLEEGLGRELAAVGELDRRRTARRTGLDHPDADLRIRIAEHRHHPLTLQGDQHTHPVMSHQVLLEGSSDAGAYARASSTRRRTRLEFPSDSGSSTVKWSRSGRGS